MARIFITGSTDGLGLANARTLVNAGHEVLLHARTREPTTALDDLAPHTAVLRAHAGPRVRSGPEREARRRGGPIPYSRAHQYGR